MKKVRLIYLVFLTFVNISHAQWSIDPAENNAICLHGGNQTSPQIASDSFGGAIIVWSDPFYVVNGRDIFIQRINSLGEVDWKEYGDRTVDICKASGDQNYPQIIKDDSGGAIIAWEDDRNTFVPDIYAQKINSSGEVQWKENGVIICTADGVQENLQIISDDSGGAIITWEDGRNNNEDIYAQRINSSGEVQWTIDGVLVCSAPGYQFNHQIASDGSGGAIITWMDERNNSYNIYAQRINSSGEIQWISNGVCVSTLGTVQYNPKLVNDGSGGAIITWSHYTDAPNYDIYAQRINSSGEVQWGSEGIAVCTDSLKQDLPEIANDGSGGVIITWKDERDGGDIYAQRINSSGEVQWASNGVPVSKVAVPSRSQIANDGSGGVMITWEDSRNGWDNTNIYAQKINSSGEAQWTSNGIIVSSAAGNQFFPQLTNDASGGAIITWYDLRNGNDNADIYAQKVDALGNLGIVGVERENELPLEYSLSQNYPNPFNPTTTIKYSIPKASLVSLKVYDILGREVATLVNEEKNAGTYKINFNASSLASGVYFYRLKAGNYVSTKKLILLK